MFHGYTLLDRERRSRRSARRRAPGARPRAAPAPGRGSVAALSCTSSISRCGTPIRTSSRSTSARSTRSVDAARVLAQAPDLRLRLAAGRSPRRRGRRRRRRARARTVRRRAVDQALEVASGSRNAASVELSSGPIARARAPSPRSRSSAWCAALPAADATRSTATRATTPTIDRDPSLTTAVPPTSSRRSVAVAADRDAAVCRRLTYSRPRRPIASRSSSPSCARRIAAREQLRTVRRHDDAAADLLDDLRRLAVGVGRDDHRPADGEDAVQPARNDVAREPAREPDDVDVRATRASRPGPPAAGSP